MKIAYIGIDLFYPALEILFNLGYEIAEIFTCETDNVTEFNVKIIEFAQKNKIPYTKQRITVSDIERLKEKECSFAICAGYYYKIPVDSKFPMLNIHPSLLPVGRGSWPMPQTILKGMKKSGVTFHKIAEDFDTGDILLQKEFEVSEDENLKSFMEKAYNCLPEMLEELTFDFERLYSNATPQPQGEYWAAPEEKDYTITPDMFAKEADLILRAFLGYECIYKKGSKKFALLGGKLIESVDDKESEFSVKGGYIIYNRMWEI